MRLVAGGYMLIESYTLGVVVSLGPRLQWRFEKVLVLVGDKERSLVKPLFPIIRRRWSRSSRGCVDKDLDEVDEESEQRDAFVG
jgi:hypothetical protein